MERAWMMAGMRTRVAISIFAGVGWLSFVLLYAAFWSSGYTLFQSIVIVLVSVLVLGGIMGAMWASWGMHFAG